MSLYEILACPICKVRVERHVDQLECKKCGRKFPIVNDIPVMLPDLTIPNIVHENELNIINSYNPWVHRVILQSLLDNQIVLEVGSGNMILDDPNIIRMDVTLTPYVDLVADAHYLPFLPESLDYIFSLAVFEHLRNPFLAARSMYESLKDGGYIYHECNFVFAYHGYPHHYFNASLQGMEQIFSEYTTLRKGVAPYQMPSFAIEMVLGTYLHNSHVLDYEHGQRIARIFQNVLDQDLRQYDIYFREEEALKVAAGTYFSGVKRKSPSSTLIPEVIHAIWNIDPDCRQRFPIIDDLTTISNILLWAKMEGRISFPQIDNLLSGIVPFTKKEKNILDNRRWLADLPLIEPVYCSIGANPNVSMEVNAQNALENERNKAKATRIQGKLDTPSLFRKGIDALRNGGLRKFLGKGLLFLGHKILRY